MVILPITLGMPMFSMMPQEIVASIAKEIMTLCDLSSKCKNLK